MSLPDVPNTLREKYYSVMAGQNDADILPDIDTAPSTENRYLDFIARNGGGGGGDVTKAYVDEQDAKKTDKVTSAISGNFAGLDANGNLTDSGKKATDFATASDMSDVQSVIPSTATTQNKLATAADVTNEDISATSTTSPLTNSTDGYVQGLTVKGHSEVVSGAIKSIGDTGWGVVDLGTLTWTRYTPDNGNPYFQTSISEMYSETEKLNEDLYCPAYQLPAQPISARNLSNLQIMRYETNIYIRNDAYTNATAFKSAMSGVLLYYPLANTTGATPTLGITSKDGAGQGTAATITTGLPLRSVSDSIFDTLDNDKVTKKCAEVDLGDLSWAYNSQYQFFATTQAVPNAPAPKAGGYDAVCSDYQITHDVATNMSNKTVLVFSTNQSVTAPGLVVKDTDYTDAATFTTAVTGVKLVYPLATPIETPLTSAEKTALASLRTYDHTTYIDATDAPTMTVDYLRNTENGKAVANLESNNRPKTAVLYNNTAGTVHSLNSEITLSEDYRNYDKITLEWEYVISGGHVICQNSFSSSLLDYVKDNYGGSAIYETSMLGYNLGYSFAPIAYNKFKITEIAGLTQAQCRILRIVGESA